MQDKILRRLVPVALRGMRARAGVSQAELARRARLSAARLSAIEAGWPRDLKLSTLVRLCLALDTTPDVLTGFACRCAFGERRDCGIHGG